MNNKECFIVDWCQCKTAICYVYGPDETCWLYKNFKKNIEQNEKNKMKNYEKKNLYWDYVNEVVTKDSNFAKIIPNPSEFYIEQYELYNGIRINFTYTIIKKEKKYSLFEFRRNFFESHQIKENEIKRLVYLYVPYNVYKNILNYDNKRWC